MSDRYLNTLNMERLRALLAGTDGDQARLPVDELRLLVDEVLEARASLAAKDAEIERLTKALDEARGDSRSWAAEALVRCTQRDEARADLARAEKDRQHEANQRFSAEADLARVTAERAGYKDEADRLAREWKRADAEVERVRSALVDTREALLRTGGAAEAAESEVARLRSSAEDSGDGSWEADVTTRVTPEFREHFAVSLAQIMIGANAPNYVEMHVVDPRDDRRFTVTIQRAEGKTPGQLKDEAVKERDEARAELLSAREAIRGLTVAVERVAFTHRWADEHARWASGLSPDEAVLCDATKAARAAMTGVTP